jgi:hypothetical protein
MVMDGASPITGSERHLVPAISPAESDEKLESGTIEVSLLVIPVVQPDTIPTVIGTGVPTTAATELEQMSVSDKPIKPGALFK